MARHYYDYKVHDGKFWVVCRERAKEGGLFDSEDEAKSWIVAHSPSQLRIGLNRRMRQARQMKLVRKR